MTPREAEAFAAQVIAAIPSCGDYGCCKRPNADRARVARDLAGLLDHRHDPIAHCTRCKDNIAWPCPDEFRYTQSLTETGALYGVKP